MQPIAMVILLSTSEIMIERLGIRLSAVVNVSHNTEQSMEYETPEV